MTTLQRCVAVKKKKLLSPEAGILTPDAHRLEGNSMSKNKRKVKDVDTS